MSLNCRVTISLSLAHSVEMAFLNQVMWLAVLQALCIDIAHSQSCIRRRRVIPEPRINTKVLGSAQISVITFSELNCIHRCYQVHGCVSINTKVNSKDSTICEIFTHEGSHQPKKLVASVGWKYFDLKVK